MASSDFRLTLKLQDCTYRYQDSTLRVLVLDAVCSVSRAAGLLKGQECMLCQLACWFELARHSNTGHSDVQAPHTDVLALGTVPQGATLGFRTTVDSLCWFPQRYSGITALEQARQN